MGWDRAKEADAALILGETKEEVKKIAKSKRDRITPKPMEADKVRTEQVGEAQQCDHKDEDFAEEDGKVCYAGNGGKGGEKGKVHASHAERWAAERPSARTRAGEKAKRATAREDRKDGAQGKTPVRRRGHALGAEVRPTY